MIQFANPFVRWFRHTQQIFHALVGLAFLGLGVAGAAVSFSEWRYYRSAPAVGWIRFGVLASFTVLLIILGLYSFVKARSVH